MNVKTLERCLSERIDREMSKIVDKVGDRIQSTISTAIVKTVAPIIALSLRSINAFPAQDATNVMANSERGEHTGLTAH